MSVIQYIVDLGPSLMMPIIIFVMAMFFRIPVGRAIRASITLVVIVNMVLSIAIWLAGGETVKIAG
jgi:galactitol PTS system EIIC component